MTTPREDMEPAPAVGLPLDEPEPVPGCERCAALAAEREHWRAVNHATAVSDCNVWLRRHPAHEHYKPPYPRSRSAVRRPDR